MYLYITNMGEKNMYRITIKWMLRYHSRIIQWK